MQHAAVERAAEVRLGLPAVVGAEQLERRERRDELHHRRRVHRRVRSAARTAAGARSTSCTTIADARRAASPASRNARATSRGSAAARGCAPTPSATRRPARGALAAEASPRRLTRRSTISQRALDEQRELVVGDDVGRHEVDGAADRPQQQLARQPLGEAPAREIRRDPCRPRTPRSCRSWRKSRTAGCAASGAASAVQRAARAAVGGDHVVVAEDVEHRERGAAGERVAGVRVRVQEAARSVVVVERGVDRVGGEHARQRQVAAGDALRQAQEVRRDARPARTRTSSRCGRSRS